ncbi:helix-turn-helix transcriptional regulator [Spirillospora sp. NPDC049652]
MAVGSSPTVRRRRLAAELKALRLSKGMTGVEASRRMEADPSWISRIESGRRGIKTRDLRLLLDVYEVEDEEYREGLLDLARQAKQRGWWHTYTDVIPDDFQDYVGLEAEADSLRVYQAELVPGLLQTSDYHRALLQIPPSKPSEDEIERRVQLRLARQQRLTAEDRRLDLWVVLNEAVLRRVIGGAETMATQLTHLVEAGELSNVTIQVLPFSAGAHQAMTGSFVALGFPETADADLVYIEQQVGTLYVEDAGQVRPYTVAFDHLRAMALSPENSLRLIADVAKEYMPA